MTSVGSLARLFAMAGAALCDIEGQCFLFTLDNAGEGG